MTTPDLAAAFETLYGRPLDTGYRADVEAVERPDAWLADTCTAADVDHETATGPDRAGRITVTGWCEHGVAVTQTYDGVL